jgi:Tfp pilus assembly protein PilN
MRPVNLIPQAQRRSRDVSRSGPLAYIVVAGLVALLAGVVVLVLSSNQISERESELSALNAKKTAVLARADLLAPYAKFQHVQRQRSATVVELADGRFDWPRVLRQLSEIIPKYVLLTQLTGLAGQGISEGGEGGGGSSGGADLAGEVKGPSLSMEGCARNQKRVAALIAALHQIDGVTRIGLDSAVTEKADSGGEGGGESSSACSADSVLFKLAVAFDAAPASPDAAPAGEAETAPVAEESSSESSSSEGESAEPKTATKTEADGSKTTVSKTTTVTPPSN